MEKDGWPKRLCHRSEDSIGLLIELGNCGDQRIEALHTSTAIKHPPRDLILDQKEEGMKLYEDTIVKSNTMN